MLRRPSPRAPIDILFVLCCIILIGDVLVPEIWGRGKTKDYPLWYWAGQQVLQGRDLYPSDPNQPFPFLYPPLSAVLLAIPSWFGKVPLYLCLALLNAVAWGMTSVFSNAMTGSGRLPGQWLFALPAFVTITFVFDMFDLGQPNLVLLAMMLCGFWTLQHQRPWLGGSLFALATALKVFPVAVIPYLLWRRQWKAVASTVLFIVFFLFVLPAPFRGFQHNFDELTIWYHGMVASSSEKGFGQRDEQNWSWVNQSIIAVTHRLTRPIDYNRDDPNSTRPRRTMNVLDFDYAAANWIVLAVSVALGLGFITIMPDERRRTPRSDAEELGILFCLMTLASPLARQYYFIWLFYPVTILIHRAAYDPRGGARTGTSLALAGAGILMLLSLGIFPKDFQAWGNNLAATAILAAALGWHLLHPLEAGSPPPGELKAPMIPEER